MVSKNIKEIIYSDVNINQNSEKNQVMDVPGFWESIEKVFFECGIIIDEEDWMHDLDMDSIDFVSLIVSIEETFGITVPPDMLLYEKWKNVSLIEENINHLIAQEH